MGGQPSPKRRNNFVCQFCARRFVRHEHLQRHERLHTNEKPFSCTQCSSSYTRRDLLARHVNSEHQQQNIAPCSFPMIHLDASSFDKSNERRIVLPSPETAEANFDGVPPFTTISSLSRQNGTATDSTHLNFDEGGTLATNMVEATNYFPPDGYDVPFVSNLDFNQFLMLSPLPSLAAKSPPQDGLEKPVGASTPNSYAPKGTDRSRCSWTPLSAVSDISASASEQRKLYWAIADGEWEHFVTTITRLCPEYAESQLPSRQSISRYLAAYFRSFHEHLPFLHPPTINLHDTRAHLVVAIATIGAQYCLEIKNMVSLFSLAKLMVLKGIDSRRRACVSRERLESEKGNPDEACNWDDDAIQSCQTLLLLMITATWGDPKTTLKEDMNLQSILATFLREEKLLGVDSSVKHRSWQEWIRAEGVIRTILITFCFFNFHTILHNIPPPILNSEIQMVLPCHEEEWRCSTAASWAEEHANGKTSATQPEFSVAYKSLFHPTAFGGLKSCSSLGIYVLITAIVQHIYFVRQLSKYTLYDHTTTTPVEIDTLHQALCRWQEIWEMDPHRSLGPNNPDGPLPFNSTALLRIAYVRLGMDIGSSFTMGSRNPQQIAYAMLCSSPVPRNQHSTRAALHAAHTLNTPVKIGLKLVAKTQALTWSLQHSLSYLESAFLLSKWLENVMRSLDDPPLDEEEQQVLSYVQGILHEAVDKDDQEMTACTESHLGISLIRIWAQLILEEGIWPIVNMVGKTLALYADLLAANIGGDVS